MSIERWQRIEALFAAAAERPAGERSVFLDEECGDDQELRTEMENLFLADGEAGAFIEQAVEAEASAFTDDAFDSRIGGRIGPYQLVTELGRGGMSSVYLGVRADEQFRKRVAVKLIRVGMDTDDILRRFLAERQILASLDHSNIARLYDGGTTDDGLPYFIMEYIEGQPLDVYCDERNLTIRDRLSLFRSVCAAVHYAHRNLVVHRDLKPSNILVTTDGVPKLLDFGIAKLINPELAEGTLETTGKLVKPMTPGYASPEQISGGLITTASDVYSLGVVLYELLTGRRPYSVEGGPGEIVRAVCVDPPARPSSAVSRRASEETDPAAVSHARGTTPEPLRRALTGDLDNIVLMAMRKEPARRYGSAEQLAEDLRRHLEGRPVIAHQDTLRYRCAKFVRRHRLGVSVAVTVVGLILALVVALVVQSARVMRERDRAARVSAMLKDLFEIADSGEVRGSSITALELLDRGAERVRQLGDEPDTAMLLDTLARLYEELGLYTRSVPLHERSLAIYRSTFAGDSVEVAAALNRLGVALALKGSFSEAEPLFREALGIYRRIFGEAHPTVVNSMNKLGLVLHDLGHLGQARTLYEEAIALQVRAGFSEKERATLPLDLNLALLHFDIGEYAGAEARYRDLIELRQRVFGREHRHLADGLDGLGMTLHARGAYEEAEASLREALDLRLTLLGEDHREVARTRTNLGRLLCDRGRREEAEDLLHLALGQRLKLIGGHHPEIASTLGAMALCQDGGGDLEAAESLYRRALEIYQGSLPKTNPLAVDVMLELGHLHERRGECDRAVPLLREALAIRQRVLPPDSWQLAEAESALGGCLAALGRDAEARPLLEGSVEPLARELGPDHPRTRRVRERLALLR